MHDELTREVSTDPRVAAALAVVRGFPVSLVADQQAVPIESVERWTAAFLGGGAARVAGTVDPDPSGVEGRLIDLILREVGGLLPVLRSGVPDLMDQAAFALDRIVHEVKETADLVLGRLPLQVRAIDLTALVLQLAVPGKVEVLASDPVVVVADPVRLGGALQGLVDTALREVMAHKAITVRIAAGLADRVEVHVEQPGALTPARARRLMEPFALEGVPATAPAAGLGLGLFLARAVAVAHGGLVALDLEDDGFGARSVYRLRLPVAGPVPGPLVERMSDMRYTFACGDVMPGCAATFEAGSVDEIFAQVVPHAEADHGITEVSPEVAEAVQGAIHSHD